MGLTRAGRDIYPLIYAKLTALYRGAACKIINSMRLNFGFSVA